jgi:hypothetical protein
MQIIKLPTKQLQEFLALAGYVTSADSETFPLDKFIKVEIVFGTCILTKASYKDFIKFSFDSPLEDNEFLLDEKKICIICSATKESEIEVKIQDDLSCDDYGIVYLKSGIFEQEFNIGGYEIANFRKLPSVENGGHKLDKSLLSCLAIAKAHTSNDKLLTNFTAVYLDGTDVYASSRHTLYTKSFPYSLPKIAITPNECKLLSNFSQVDYTVSDNFNIYKIGNIEYGFTRPDGANGLPYKEILSRCTKQNYIKIRLQDLITFCETTTKFSDGVLFISSLSVESETTVKILYEDRSRREKNIITTDVTLVGNKFSFNFDADTILPVLRALPYDVIYIGDEPGCVSVWTDEDPSYCGILNKMT